MKKDSPRTPLFVIWLLLSAALYAYTGYRSDLLKINSFLLVYAALFATFFLGWRYFAGHLSWKWIIVAGLFLRLIFVPAFPRLTEDYHRFLWDGCIVAQGGNPFALTPLEAMESVDFELSEKRLKLMNSPRYISVYPPLLQGIFGVSAMIFPDSPRGRLGVMRSFMILAEMVSLFVMMLMLKSKSKGFKSLALYAWNPFIITELTGNLHFEGVMIPFLLLTLYWAGQEKFFRASVALGLGVATKLLPLMFLPLFLRRWGLKKTAAATTVIGIVNATFWFPFWFNQLPSNFFSSLRLYFDHFKFNASVFYTLRWLGNVFNAGDLFFQHLGFFLSIITATFILLYSFRRKEAVNKPLAFSFLVIWSMYYFNATTVHPWYISPLIAFGVLTGVKFPQVWALYLPLTYLTYSRIPYGESLWVVQIGYSAVFGCILLESGIIQELWRNIKLKTAKRKEKLLETVYKPSDTVLDVGTGNGALCTLLQKRGVAVTALDVKDRCLFTGVSVALFNGANIPCDDKSQDYVQFITVLHHARNPEKLLSEAKRVGRTVIVMEDIYNSKWQKYLTYATDSLVNAEFLGHPHNNKTDAEWQRLFSQMGFDLEEMKTVSFLGVFTQVLYRLKAPIQEKVEAVIMHSQLEEKHDHNEPLQ